MKNNRLAATGWIWAFVASSKSPGASVHYRRRREAGDHHAAALRGLFNRLLGQLWHCLQTDQLYDPAKAYLNLPARPITATTA